MSVCDPETLINLYDWLETIPFSRPKRNLARDFSDGVLAAELIKYFFPTMVDMHNYPSSNSIQQKKSNWLTLNYKVLKKLDFPLSMATISDLTSGAKRDATEYFLKTIRERIDFYMKKKMEKCQKEKVSQENSTNDIDDMLMESLNISKDILSHTNLTEIGDAKVKEEEFSKGVKAKKQFHLSNLDFHFVPRKLYEEKVQALLQCEETILILKARIQRLEHILKMKDATINHMQTILDQLKLDGNNVNVDKLRELKAKQKKA